MKRLLGRDKVFDLIREQRAARSPGRGAGAPGLNCLVVGGDGRAYAIAWRLARDASVTTIDAVPGNGGMALFARVLDIPADGDALEQHVASARIDLAIVGPDDLVAAGLGDRLRRAGIAVVAPSRDAAKIEWSKRFAKELMDEAGVPTAAWTAYPGVAAAREALEGRDGPVVVKADGLARGKGVVVAGDRAAALAALDASELQHGAVLLEEPLAGEEASLQTLVDGETVVALPPARDHKRAGDGDTGPNTGGMGAVSPTSVLPDDEARDVAEATVAPVARALARRGTPYRGVLYAGLMRTAGGFAVLEYNARFGDPEAEVVLPRVEGDFAGLMRALGDGRLAEHVAASPPRFSERAYVDVVVCAEGYPGTPRTGDRVLGLEDLPDGVYAFHGATRRTPDGTVATTGGRAVHVVAGGESVGAARILAYEAAARIRFPGAFYRHDIAAREAVPVS